MGPNPALPAPRFRWGRLWAEWLRPRGLLLARTEEERTAQAVERRFQHHGLQVPLLRIVAILFLALLIVLHPDGGSASGLQRSIEFLVPALLYWSVCFALVRGFYRSVEWVDLGRVVACLDVLLSLLAIHATGSGRSLLLPVMLAPMSFLALTSFRLAFVASFAFPALYLGYIWLFGRSFSWETEIAKAFVLLFSDLFLTLTSLLVHGWRARLNEALDVSRDLIQQLEDRGAELAESKIKAEQASLAKSVFLSNMSHELRTPLNAILGYSQLLRRRPGLEPDVEEQLGRIQHSGEHLLGLINDVLTIAKIEAVGIVAAPAPFSPAALFRSLEDILRIRAQDKGVGFQVDTQPGFPEWVLGDENKLRQVLINLLGNAVKFTSRGQVRLAAAYADGLAHFSIEDTGPGLSPEEIEALFQRFTQTEAGRKASEGTGLGLHISQAIVKALGGEIRVESQVGQGTRFEFAIPLPPEGLPASPALPAARLCGVLAPGQTPARILVVDDQEENRDLLRRILERAGLIPLMAADGWTALQLIREERPDLVFLDIRMPGMDGFEVHRRIRQEEAGSPLPRLPVVALTASVLDHEREAVMAEGFDEYIRKPFRMVEITDCVTRFLGLRFVVPVKDPDGSIPGAGTSAPALPGPVRKELLAAIEIGDLDEALRVLDGLEDQNAAKPLRDLAKKYRFENLKDLLSREPPC